MYVYIYIYVHIMYIFTYIHNLRCQTEHVKTFVEFLVQSHTLGFCRNPISTILERFEESCAHIRHEGLRDEAVSKPDVAKLSCGKSFAFCFKIRSFKPELSKVTAVA